VFFSDVSESFLYLYPSSSNSLSVDCSRYPAQMALFAGLDSGDPNVLRGSEAEALKRYAETVGFISATSSWGFLKDLTFELTSPKLVTLSEDSLFGLYQVTVLITNAPGSRLIQVDKLGILTGSRDFAYAFTIASYFGKAFAEREIMDLYVSSEFFRASLVHEKLKAIATEILERRERDKSGKEDYPYWQFTLHRKKLTDEARKAGLTDSYAENFFLDLEARREHRMLLWPFISSLGFIFQWSLLNVVAVVFSLWFRNLRRTKRWHWYNGLFVAGVFGINAWAFGMKPDFTPLVKCTIPAVLFLITFLPLSWRQFEHLTKK
jgi:hypothetical protein